jgi:hypothetical protein
MSAFVVNENLRNNLKLEYINKRISVLKIITNDRINEKFHGYALIGVYMSSNNNSNREYEIDLATLVSVYNRIFKEGFKPIIIGDLNADSISNMPMIEN